MLVHISLHQYSQIEAANFNKNSSSCECQLSSKIQGIGEETESRERETD